MATTRFEKFVGNRFQMGKDNFTGDKCVRCGWPTVIRTGRPFTFDTCRNTMCRTNIVRTDGNTQSAYSPVFYWQFRKFSHEKNEYKAWRQARRKENKVDA